MDDGGRQVVFRDVNNGDPNEVGVVDKLKLYTVECKPQSVLEDQYLINM